MRERAGVVSLLMMVLIGLGSGNARAEEGEIESESAVALRAHLGGYQEVPAVSTLGHGELAARATQEGIAFVLRYAHLQGQQTRAVVIQFGQPGVDGGLMAVLCGSDVKPECPAGGGVVHGTLAAHDIVGPVGQGIGPGQLREALRAMRRGRTYVNVLTTRFPRGEIRGQIVSAERD